MKNILEGVSPFPNGPFKCWFGSKITFPNPKCGDETFLDVRGWGFLTGGGLGALGLDAATAEKIQKEWGNEVCRRLNTYEARESLIAELEKVLDSLENLTAADAARVASALTRAKEVMKG